MFYVISFVYNSGIKNKQMYIDLIKTQFNDAVLLLIFYNAYCEKSGDDVKKIMINIGFFKKLNKELLLDPDHINLFPSSAFGSDH